MDNTDVTGTPGGPPAHGVGQRRAEEALRRSEARYRALVDATSQAVWLWSPHGDSDFALAQQWWEELTGQSPAEQRAHSGSWLEVVHPDDKVAAATAWQTAIATVSLYDIEYRVQARAGGWRYIHARGVPIPDPAGGVCEWVGTLNDITERKRGEAELRQSEARLRRLASAGIIGVIRWNLSRSLILDANDEFLRMTGYNRTDLDAGKLNFRAMTPPEWTPRNEEGIQHLRATGVGGAYEKEYFRKDGTRVPVIIVGVRFEEADDEGMSFVLDITERKQAEQALRASEGLLRLATDAAELGVWVWDVAEDRVTWENARPYELFGLDPLAAPVNAARFMSTFVHPDDTAAFAAALAEVKEKEGRFYFLGRIRRTDGEIRWIELTGLPVRAATGSALRMHGTVADVTARKRAEAENQRLLLEVEAERRRLADVFQSAPSFMCVLRGPDHIFELANDRYFELLGHRDIIGRSVKQAIPELEGQGFLEILDRVYTNGAPFVGTDMQIVLQRGDRLEERILEFVYQPMRDAAGAVSGILAHGIDLTDRKRAEQGLARVTAESERRGRMFDTALSHTADFIYLFDLQGRFTYVNKALLDLWGKDLAQAVGKNFFDLDYPPELAARLQRQIETVIATQQPLRDETPYTSAGGTRAYEYIFMPVTAADGKVEGVAGSTRDITERKQTEEALRASEARFRTTADHAPVLIWLADSSKAGIWFNRPWLEFTGRTLEAEHGIGWTEGVHPEDRARFLDTYNRNFDARTPFTLEYRHRRHDGEYRWLLDNGLPLHGPGAEFSGYIGSCVDITERKEIEAVLREADRKKDDFLALLAHELRNPLAPIRNGLQVIRLSEDRDMRRGAQEMMERQLAHMVRLVDDLLDVSRISRNKMELRRSRVALSDVIASAVETARTLIDAGGHDLHIALPPRPIYLDADLTRLAQVFGNLLTNSARYTERGGRIWVTAERRGEKVSVSVRDTGIGIPADSLLKIFDMFSQVDRSLERSTGGLGIGLALVKGLVEMHGGTVTAASDGSGQGSTFTVLLPALADQPLPTATTASNGAGATGPRQRILVVDDNCDGADSLAMMLRLLGNEVRTATDGVEGVDVAEQFRPEVILMDVGMPRLNGLDATRHIRAQSWGRTMTIIALTGWGQEHDRERSRAAGCNGHLVKPVYLPDLEKTLQELQQQ